MSSGLAMPTEDELAEISHTELEHGSLLAYFLWQEAERLGKSTAAYQQIHKAYDTEQKTLSDVRRRSHVDSILLAGLLKKSVSANL